MRTISEVIDELKEKAQVHPIGKMGSEVYVEKKLLSDAVVYLQEYLDRLDGEI